IAYIILKAANSPRPGNWVLERSLDGETFMPWQYYAITDTECITRFNITPRTGPPAYKHDDEVICTSFYSKIHPLENGEIHTSLINGRPSADDPSPTLLSFTTARYIRFRFLRIRTLNADLMTLALDNPRDVDPIVTRRMTEMSGWYLTGAEEERRVWAVPGVTTPPHMIVNYEEAESRLTPPYYWNAPPYYLGNKGSGLRLTDRHSEAVPAPRLAGAVRRRVFLRPDSFRHLDSDAA
ncbi:laminin subunit alpha-2 isoform X4, partial [Clarias magur]